MISHPPLGITEDPLQDLNHVFPLYRQVDLLSNLPYNGLLQYLAKLYRPAWKLHSA